MEITSQPDIPRFVHPTPDGRIDLGQWSRLPRCTYRAVLEPGVVAKLRAESQDLALAMGAGSYVQPVGLRLWADWTPDEPEPSCYLRQIWINDHAQIGSPLSLRGSDFRAGALHMWFPVLELLGQWVPVLEVEGVSKAQRFTAELAVLPIDMKSGCCPPGIPRTLKPV